MKKRIQVFDQIVELHLEKIRKQAEDKRKKINSIIDEGNSKFYKEVISIEETIDRWNDEDIDSMLDKAYS